jgi:hypothetical protein
VLGGRLATELRLTPGATYLVDRDISVLNYGRLIVPPGTVLEFGNCLGALVEGYVEIAGNPDSYVTLRLRNESTWFNNSLVRLSGQAMAGRAIDEWEVLEGRLEVRPSQDDEWGTVCREVCIQKYLIC